MSVLNSLTASSYTMHTGYNESFSQKTCTTGNFLVSCAVNITFLVNFILFQVLREYTFFPTSHATFQVLFSQCAIHRAALIGNVRTTDACSSNSFSLFSRCRMDRDRFYLPAPTVLVPACEIRPESLLLSCRSSSFP